MTDDFDDLNIETESSEHIEQAPIMGSPEWNDYVLSLLDEDEFAEDVESGKKHPICHGLRRVAHKLLGHISGGVKEVIYPNSSDPRRVVVVYEIRVGSASEGIPFDSYVDVSDASLDNTDPFFLNHAVATASTKAEARCLRKALLIKGLAADELKSSNRNELMGLVVKEKTVGDYNDDEEITSRQMNYMDTLASKADINVLKLIEETFDGVTVDQLKKGHGSELNKVLDNYRGNREEVPEHLLGYDKTWKGDKE